MMARVLSFWRNLVRRDRLERDLDEEIRAALELLIEEKIKAGMSSAEARRAAAIELRIESVKQQVRDVRIGSFVETLLQDLRYAARLLRRNPLFTLTAALSLSIGIGATTTIFTVANGLLLTAPPGVAEPSRLVDVARTEDGDVGIEPISYPDFLVVRERVRTLQDVYGYDLNLDSLSLTDAGTSERIFGNYVTTNFFTVLGVQPVVGHLFGPSFPERPGSSPFVVLSHRFWLRRFNGDTSVVGRTLTLNGQALTVTGVATADFRGMSVMAPDIWVPAVMIPVLTPANRLDFSASNRLVAWQMMAGGRLGPGVSRGEAAAEIAVVGESLERENDALLKARFPDGMRGSGPVSWSVAASSPIPPGLRLAAAGFLALLMAIVAVVLIIACANLAGVLLARAVVRRREIAVRVATGAGRARVIRQLLTETALLFVIGGTAGLVLARWLTSLLLALLPAFPVPVNLSMSIDGRVAAFSLVLSLVAAVIAGLAPALHASKADVVTALKDDSPGPADRQRLRQTFVVAQVAFSVLLVVTAGILIRALDRATRIDQGFEPRGVEVASIDLSMAGYTEDTGPVFARDLIERVRALPGVEHATLANRLPDAGGMSLGPLTVPGSTPPPGQRYFYANWTIVDAAYFPTLRVPIVAGRDFTANDRANSPMVAIVGQEAARRFWPGKDPIGQVLLVHGPSQQSTPLTVVGVVRDLRMQGPRAPVPLALYVPLQQRYMPGMNILVRVADGVRLAGDLRALVSSMNPNLPVLEAQALERQQNGPVQTQLRIAASVAASVGLVGLLLAAIGIYGITAYTVTQRTREIGIRLSLGADADAVVRMVLRQGIVLVGVGVGVGLLLGAGAGQILSGARFAAPRPDAAMLLGAAAIFAAVGLVACYLPARRAARIGPIEALRYE